MKLLVAALAVVALAITGVGDATSAPPPAEFQDPSGDSSPGPDITK